MRPRVPSTAEAFPLGVDLVELKKAKAFYRRHRRRLGGFFTRREQAFIGSGQRSPMKLAMLWAAKEAAMKSRGLPAVGPGALAAMEIAPTGQDRARVARTDLRVTFVRTRHFVVASCYALGPTR